MSKAERLLSYSLLSSITSTPLSSTPLGIDEDPGDTPQQRNGLLNEEGAWCWREGCQGCLKLTKAMQKTSDGLQIVADLYEDHAWRTQKWVLFKRCPVVWLASSKKITAFLVTGSMPSETIYITMILFTTLNVILYV
ncbi:hypothetical protein EV424DRAFT_788466 [Suillus variegatus]|nr:hypothetical protein EV424DRAFT_788466 [Suillus variegatus]